MGPNVTARSAPRVDAGKRAREFLGDVAPAPDIHPAPGVDPDRVFAAAARQPYPVYLWGHGRFPKGRYSIIAHSPYATLRSNGHTSSLQRSGARLELPVDGLLLASELTRRPGDPETDLPFVGGAIGYVSYEYARSYIELPRARTTPLLPGCHFAFYDRAFVYDHSADSGYWIGPPGSLAGELVPRGARLTEPWQPSVAPRVYGQHVQQILTHIARGDIYQANYTLRYRAAGTCDPHALALHLKRAIPTPMGAYLHYPFGVVWSVSPERLVSGHLNARVESRPIKGTRPRSDDATADRDLANALATSAKDKAELLMIVDLVRNDLGRVGRFGSVRVDELFGLQSYANVHHLEAVVSAAMRPGVTWVEVLQALLPGGSVTGAPKRRAVEILAGLEPVPRSVYCGAIGYLSNHGRADFNLAIRTLYHAEGSFYLHSGGGIVADSTPELEQAELEVKVRNIREALA